jgi:hypothetical protein
MNGNSDRMVRRHFSGFYECLLNKVDVVQALTKVIYYNTLMAQFVLTL